MTTDVVDPADLRVSLGGSAGIARNTFGLRGAVSYLIETRGVGIGLQSYQRRVATHYPAGQGGARDDCGRSRRPAERLAAARAAAAADRSDLIVSHKEGEREVELPLIDAESGAARPTRVRLSTAATSARSMCGRGRWVISCCAAAMRRRAPRLNEAVSCRVASSGPLPSRLFGVRLDAARPKP